ncbi:hypothetical protein BASA83_005203 [Batrachochytrium salamandrivorans]|nr:hypothetical protein BASA83_005203 [Batrachochytrium salamandrivorans]
MATTSIFVRDHPSRTIVVRPPTNFSSICIVFSAQQTDRGLCSSVLLQPADTIDFASLRLLLATPVHGCLGTITIDNDVFIALVVEAEIVGVLEDQSIFRILKTLFFSLLSNKYDKLHLEPAPSTSASVFGDEQPIILHPCQLLIKLLSYGSFYYSSSFDLTRRMDERLSPLATSTPSESLAPTSSVLDTMNLDYVWNRGMLRQILQIREQELTPQSRLEFDRGEHLLVIIQGFFGLDNVVSKSGKWQLGIISRLGCNRAGTRFNARGINDDGHVSNFVETEFLMINAKYKTSFLQIRGSVPVFWEQTGVQVSHKVVLSRGSESAQPAAVKHFEELVRLYSAVQIVNLLAQSPTSPEYALTESYRTAVALLPRETADSVLYSTFDFHAVIKRDQYERLDSLLPQVQSSMKKFGYFVFDIDRETPVLRQTGVFRTNCLDCLDRTNVIQTYISRQMLDAHLSRFGIQLNFSDQDLWTRAFNGLWADSSYTRNGKQTMLGYLDDAAKSVNRFYVSNFQDKGKQEAIDLLFSKGHTMNNLLLRNPVYELVEREMEARIHEYAKPFELSILLGTYNLHGKMPTSDMLSLWLNTDKAKTSDMIIIGVQELIELTPDRYISADTNLLRLQLEAELLAALNSRPFANYVVLRSLHLVALGIFVFIRHEMSRHIRKLETSVVKTGLGGMAANKGGIGISMNYHDTSLAFVTAHFAAGSNAIEERNRDYWTVTNGLIFRGRKLYDHDMIFWLGDFNYRVDLLNEEVRKCVKTNNLKRLIENDQLGQQIHRGLAFNGFKEGALTFDPTYKYDSWSTNYDTSEKARTPSWTDRILFKGKQIKLQEYSRGEIQISDHRPVLAVLVIQVNEIDFQARNAIQSSLLKKHFDGVCSIPAQNPSSRSAITSKKIPGVPQPSFRAERIPSVSAVATGTLIDVTQDPGPVVPLTQNPFITKDPLLWSSTSGPLPPPSSDDCRWWDSPPIPSSYATNVGDKKTMQVGVSLLD